MRANPGCAEAATITTRRDAGQRYPVFPEVSRLAQARLTSLRACGLSQPKAEALRHGARALERGELDEAQLAALGCERALSRLMELPGIGPWSAALLLLRGMRRLEVFPPGDVGVARALARTKGIAPGAALERLVARFGDQRGYLYFHALGSSLLAKKLIQPAP